MLEKEITTLQDIAFAAPHAPRRGTMRMKEAADDENKWMWSS